jgi:AraC family transcriptional regulator of adaptative response/methylated-DNA-[protein]-cysteine methyltransferase
MLDAIAARDRAYEGVFVTAVTTTGIFCRPTCPARKPLPQHVEFFPSPRDALLAGFRPCKRCHPMEPAGQPPAWLRPFLDQVEDEPARRWRDRDVRALGMSPERVRRWFQEHHGMTFQAYSRARRLGAALGSIQHGSEVTMAALESGYESLSGFHDAFRQLYEASPTAVRDAPVATVTRIPTPLGTMVAAATAEALILLEFVDRRMLETQIARLRRQFGYLFAPGTNPILDHAAADLTAYFAGTLTRFTVPIAIAGTPFQESVWRVLLGIDYGTTASYADVARRIGQPSAVRAVARANGDNRLAIIVPCHRVVGSDGSLTGYGGGLWRKRKLLEIEARGAGLALA